MQYVDESCVYAASLNGEPEKDIKTCGAFVFQKHVIPAFAGYMTQDAHQPTFHQR